MAADGPAGSLSARSLRRRGADSGGLSARCGLAGITLECRGHGGSDAGDVALFSIARFADDIAEFIAARRLAPLVVGGISMGAAIAMRLAVTRPDLVRRARHRAAGLVGPGSTGQHAAECRSGRASVQDGPEAARQAFAAGISAQRLASESPDNLASLMGFFSREPLAMTAALLTSIARDGPGIDADQLRRVAVPTLVIATRMDVVHPLSLAEELASFIPRARLTEITPKGVDRKAYVAEFRNTLAIF